MNNYIITNDSAPGEGRIGMPVTTEMSIDELTRYVQKKANLIHPRGKDKLFMLGQHELINPRVMTPNDYANFAPYIL